MLRPFLLAVSLVVLAAGASLVAAFAEPTAEERDAIRAACRSDFMANCAGVQPGGRDALECLVHHQASLSAACASAVKAIAAPAAAPAPAPAASEAKPAAPAAPASAAEPASQPGAPATTQPVASPTAAKPPVNAEAELATLRHACTLDDMMAHCAWIPPNNPELVLCLKANATDLSSSCQTALQALPAPPKPAAAAPPSPPKPAARSTASPASAPSAAVPPIAPPMASPPAPAAVAPLAPMPPLRPRRALAILKICDAEKTAFCGGIPAGGGRLIACLAANAGRLSPPCYAAMAEAKR
jgi:hypothetical protein